MNIRFGLAWCRTQPWRWSLATFGDDVVVFAVGLRLRERPSGSAVSIKEKKLSQKQDSHKRNKQKSPCVK